MKPSVDLRKSLTLSIQQLALAGDMTCRSHVRACLSMAQESPAEVTVRFVDEMEGRSLNREFRAKDYATNVLTFVYGSEPVCAGDLVICPAVVLREASEQGKKPRAHLAHLLVHGMLHLQGYDHEEDNDAAAMEAVEIHILRKLGYTDPYVVTRD